MATEEPHALIAHVWVCGGAVGNHRIYPAPSTAPDRLRRRESAAQSSLLSWFLNKKKANPAAGKFFRYAPSALRVRSDL
jgi:hypothetical protein